MSTTSKQVRDWIAKHNRAQGNDGAVLALILEVIELRDRIEKLEAKQEQGANERRSLVAFTMGRKRR